MNNNNRLVIKPANNEAIEEGGEELAGEVGERCLHFLEPLLVKLDERIDLRLVRTAANTITAIVRHRDRPMGLLLSELGGYLAGPRHAPAGTKRLGNLLHSSHWQASDIESYLLEEGRACVDGEAKRVEEGRALCIMDGSVMEKAESVKAEGLSPVRSSKARRLSRPRPKMGKGYYRGKPGGPIVVPGFEWVGVLLTGWAAQSERRPITLGAWHWYSKPREDVEDKVPRQAHIEAQRRVLKKVVEVCGAEKLLHVWDRGMSGANWLGEVLDQQWHFVVRWKKGNKLRAADAASVGNPDATEAEQQRDGVKAWELTRGLRNWDSRRIANPRNPKQPITIGFAARPVRLLHRDDELWLVVVRLGKGSKHRRGSNEPWRLLTTERVESIEECWRVVEAYIARWNVEQMLRFGKSELGIESIRVRAWEARHKLLALVSLAYAFLLDLLGDSTDAILQSLLRWAHRTGKRARECWRSLYRLRAALSALWILYTPTFQPFS